MTHHYSAPTHWDKQFQQASKIAASVNGSLSVVTTHTSKGITLPVVKVLTEHLSVVVRDNFYGLNLWIRSDREISLPLDEVYATKDYDWYRDQIAKKDGYTFAGWTGDEVDDPRILRVLICTGSHSYWKTVSPEEKDRWLARHYDTSWYERDWASGKLLTGKPAGFYNPNFHFSVATFFYLAPRCFLEGIFSMTEFTEYRDYSDLSTPYRGASAMTKRGTAFADFCIAKNNWQEAEEFVCKLYNHLKDKSNAV